MTQPVIKWSGSKRKVAAQLSALAPNHGSYFEPFVGGGSMIPHMRPRAGIVSDSLVELIELWKMIKYNPETLAQGYQLHWENLQKQGHTYYYEAREHFNLTRDPVAFLFLSRTCVNGLIRFNSSGNFNNSLHHTRPGISPSTLRTIISEWSQFLTAVEIRAGDYADSLASAEAGDFAFLDPPYAGTKGRYMPEKFDYSRFCDVLVDLNDRGVHWLLTVDGNAGEREYASALPEIPAVSKLRVATGHSPFTRMMKSSLDDVFETVYLNYHAVTQS